MAAAEPRRSRNILLVGERSPGVELTAPITAAEAMRLAGLGWQVVKRPVYAMRRRL
jgi:hypothetical protein